MISKIFLFLLVLLLHQPTIIFSAPNPCPCSDISLCNPVTVGPRPELFAFRVPSRDPDDIIWQSYNWSILTTIAVFGNVSADLFCYAHSKNVRIVRGWDIPNDQLTNVTYVEEWVNTTATMVRENYWDGINLDIEGNTANANALTTATQLLYNALKQDNPYAQLTFDTAAFPLEYQDGYDFKALANLCDFLIPMFYDMDWGSNIAGSNSNYQGIIKGLQQYTTTLNIPSSKVLLALPWYSYVYPCTNPPPASLQTTSSTLVIHDNTIPTCKLDNWNNAADWSQTYGNTVDDLLPLAPNSTYTIDPVTESGVFSFMINSTAWKQVWFDPVETLLVKYQTAKNGGFRGIAMWYAECLNYTEPTQVNAMWGAIAEGFFS